MRAQGAELAFTFQGERLGKRVVDLAASLDSSLTFDCDVADDASISSAFTQLGNAWTDGYDIVVHAIAFAPREALEGGFVEATSRDAFRVAHDISSYSLTAVANAAAQKLREGGSLLTLSYLGGCGGCTSNYNVMGLAKASLEANVRYLAADMGPTNGVRVNGISAGPIKTSGSCRHLRFSEILGPSEEHRPAQKERHHRGSRECGGIFVFRPCRRNHRGDSVRRR